MGIAKIAEFSDSPKYFYKIEKIILFPGLLPSGNLFRDTNRKAMEQSHCIGTTARNSRSASESFIRL